MSVKNKMKNLSTHPATWDLPASYRISPIVPEWHGNTCKLVVFLLISCSTGAATYIGLGHGLMRLLHYIVDYLREWEWGQ